MATVQEMMLEMMDAAASTETAAEMSAGDTFEGTLNSKTDEDWIRIELTAGMLYTIDLEGRGDMGSTDTILRLYDSKGGFIKMNDDVDGAKGNLNSEFYFEPVVSGYYYISASSYNGNPNQDNSGDYMVTVTAVEAPDPTLGEDIEGTLRVEDDLNTDDVNEYVSGNDKLRGTDKNETIMGLSGDDALFGFGGDDTLEGGEDNDLLVGGPGADTLKGGPGEDTISYNVSPAGVTINLEDGTARGGDADGDTIVDMPNDRIEHIVGSPHDDELTGNRGNNTILGLGGNDELDGGRGLDTLRGGSGDDDLDGGRNNDTLEGGPGADMLTGGDGDGTDTASYEGSVMGVTVRLHTSKSMGGDAEGDTFASMVTAEYTNEDGDDMEMMVPDIINLIGSANADILAGDLRDNMIEGGDGDDKIYGGPGPSDGTGTGDDSNADTLMGAGGDDMIFGGAGDDTLDGGDGNDMLVGGAGDDEYMGGAGDDMIIADADDTPGNTPGTANIDGGDGNDTISYANLEDTPGARTLGGSTLPNIENIIGSQDDDEITGDEMDNVIEGGEGGDELDGGGNPVTGDTLSYASSDDWVRVTLADNGPAATSRGHASGDTATNFENVMGSAYDDDLTGNNVANRLTGGDGDDELVGADGDDTLEGGAGADELDGDNGSESGQVRATADVLSYASSNAGVTVNLAASSASGGHAAGDTIVTFEAADPDSDDEDDMIDVSTFEYVTGSMHNDRLTGDHRGNHLVGGGGDDTLRGGAGEDLLIGGPGADMLDGGSSASGDNNTPDDDSDDPQDIDWAVYKHAEEGVTVNLATGMGTAGEAMGDTLDNIELVWGSEHDDTFIASNGADIIEGDGGSDTVSYEASELGVTVDLSDNTQHTTVDVQGTGDDIMFPEDEDVNAVDSPASGLDGVDEIATDTNEAVGDDNPNTNGAAGDKLRSIENLTGTAQDDNLTGDGNPNTLRGNGGDDTIIGGDGDDPLLYGGPGEDTINGGEGDDKLVGCTGDDTLNGDAGADMLIGLAGSDDLTGGIGDDTFVFSTADSGDSDAILDYSDGDMIDLSAFELTAEQVIGAITLRGSGPDAYVVINLTEYGGGRITIDDINDLDDLDDTSADNYVGDDDMINTLNEDIFILG